MEPELYLASIPPALQDALAQGWEIRQRHFPDKRIVFDYPVDTAVVSLTGAACALRCAHCNARYLEHMLPIEQALEKAPDAPSYLISGGSDRTGKVPVTAHLEEIAELARHGRLNWHVGLIDESEMDAIAPYVHTVSFDFVGDDATIREVYGLERTVEDYVRVFKALSRRFRVVPHITIGLRGGGIGHELPALRILQDMPQFDTLVFLVLIPTAGTAYADRQPPAVETVLDIILQGRRMFPDVEISLGCMRPHGGYRERLDPLAVWAGVNRIVSPARSAIQLAEGLGLRVERRSECCIF
ncbi:MAG: radical SAM protein [Anaerolineae bacterium]